MACYVFKRTSCNGKKTRICVLHIARGIQEANTLWGVFNDRFHICHSAIEFLFDMMELAVFGFNQLLKVLVAGIKFFMKLCCLEKAAYYVGENYQITPFVGRKGPGSRGAEVENTNGP